MLMYNNETLADFANMFCCLFFSVCVSRQPVRPSLPNSLSVDEPVASSFTLCGYDAELDEFLAGLGSTFAIADLVTALLKMHARQLQPLHLFSAGAHFISYFGIKLQSRDRPMRCRFCLSTSFNK